MTNTKDEMPKFCTMRDGDDEIYIECRFPNGEKYSAVTVDIEKQKLAAFIHDAINTHTDTIPKQEAVDVEELINKLKEMPDKRQCKAGKIVCHNVCEEIINYLKTPEPSDKDHLLDMMAEALEQFKTAYPYNPPCHDWEEKAKAHDDAEQALAKYEWSRK